MKLVMGAITAFLKMSLIIFLRTALGYICGDKSQQEPAHIYNKEGQNRNSTMCPYVFLLHRTFYAVFDK